MSRWGAIAAVCPVIAAGIVTAACSGGAATVPPTSAGAPATEAALGGSQAFCKPSPCRPGAYVRHRIRVDDGAGRTVTRTFAIYRPRGLTNARSNKAPLVVDINNGGWYRLAVNNRFVVVIIPNNVHCRTGGSNCQYQGRAANPDPRRIGVRDCGPSRNAPCDDAPWVEAVLDAVSCSGPSPCQNIDRRQVFASGSSKGGFMVNDLMCDRRTSRRFSGFAVFSIPMISPSRHNDPRALPRCAAVLGRHRNVDFSAQWIFGDRDPVWNSRCRAHVDCLEKGFTDVKNRWNFGMAQIAGDARFGQRVIGAALGCSGRARTTRPTPRVIRRDYGSCAVRRRATSYVRVVGGGHGFPGVNGVDGFDANAESWAFWLAHPGRTDTVAPAVVISRPRAGQTIKRRSGRPLRFAGSAKDRSGVSSVTLTVQLLDGRSGRCRWLDPKRGVVARACGRPVRFRARLGGGGRWHYTVPRGLRLPAGRYRVRASGTDRAGVSGNSAAARKRAIRFTLV